jgi:parallel beta-helix repeat protein
MRSLLVLPFALSLFLAPLVSACGGDDDDDDDIGDTDDGDDVTDDGDDVADDGTDDGSDLCGEIDGACIVLEPSDDDQTALQSAFLDALPGDVIFMTAGTYVLTLGLSLDVDGVTLRGEGEGQTILSFADQADGAQGILVTADDFTAEDFAIEDTAGDGIKVEGGARIIFRGVRAEWTGEPSQDNGAYGIYPVQCSDILVENSIVRGASDAGIYVGQSERAVVRNSTVENNVAGIEIENTFEADVYENTATGNTGGILVFNLPGLQVENGGLTRVFDNDIIDNNGENFAPAGNTVALVPPGTGFVALAAHDVEIFGNTFAGNQTVNVGIISYFITGNPIDDESYNPYPDSLYFHDNVFESGGEAPTGLLGLALDLALGQIDGAPENVPDIVFDGQVNPELSDPKTEDFTVEFNICASNNGDADYLDLDFDSFDENSLPVFLDPNLDAAPRDCERDPLPAVELEGVAL